MPEHLPYDDDAIFEITLTIDHLAWAGAHDGATIWANPRVTFLDPFTKSGVFLRELQRAILVQEPALDSAAAGLDQLKFERRAAAVEHQNFHDVILQLFPKDWRL